MITAPVRAFEEEHGGQDASSNRGDRKAATSHKNAVSCINPCGLNHSHSLNNGADVAFYDHIAWPLIKIAG